MSVNLTQTSSSGQVSYNAEALFSPMDLLKRAVQNPQDRLAKEGLQAWAQDLEKKHADLSSEKGRFLLKTVIDAIKAEDFKRANEVIKANESFFVKNAYSLEKIAHFNAWSSCQNGQCRNYQDGGWIVLPPGNYGGAAGGEFELPKGGLVVATDREEMQKALNETEGRIRTLTAPKPESRSHSTTPTYNPAELHSEAFTRLSLRSWAPQPSAPKTAPACPTNSCHAPAKDTFPTFELPIVTPEQQAAMEQYAAEREELLTLVAQRNALVYEMAGQEKPVQPAPKPAPQNNPAQPGGGTAQSSRITAEDQAAILSWLNGEDTSQPAATSHATIMPEATPRTFKSAPKAADQCPTNSCHASASTPSPNLLDYDVTSSMLDPDILFAEPDPNTPEGRVALGLPDPDQARVKADDNLADVIEITMKDGKKIPLVMDVSDPVLVQRVENMLSSINDIDTIIGFCDNATRDLGPNSRFAWAKELAVGAPPLSASQEVKPLLEEARKAISEGRFDEAQAITKCAMEKFQTVQHQWVNYQKKLVAFMEDASVFIEYTNYALLLVALATAIPTGGGSLAVAAIGVRGATAVTVNVALRTTSIAGAMALEGSDIFMRTALLNEPVDWARAGADVAVVALLSKFGPLSSKITNLILRSPQGQTMTRATVTTLVSGSMARGTHGAVYEVIEGLGDEKITVEELAERVAVRMADNILNPKAIAIDMVFGGALGFAQSRQPAPGLVLRTATPAGSLKGPFELSCRILGLDPNMPVTDNALRTAFKRAASRTHPDKGGSQEAFLSAGHAQKWLEWFIGGQHGRQPQVPVMHTPATQNTASATTPRSTETQASTTKPVASKTEAPVAAADDVEVAPRQSGVYRVNGDRLTPVDPPQSQPQQATGTDGRTIIDSTVPGRVLPMNPVPNLTADADPIVASASGPNGTSGGNGSKPVTPATQESDSKTNNARPSEIPGTTQLGNSQIPPRAVEANTPVPGSYPYNTPLPPQVGSTIGQPPAPPPPGGTPPGGSGSGSGGPPSGIPREPVNYANFWPNPAAPNGPNLKKHDRVANTLMAPVQKVVGAGRSYRGPETYQQLYDQSTIAQRAILPNPGTFKVDDNTVIVAATPGGLEGVTGDNHAHPWGYSGRSTAGDRLLGISPYKQPVIKLLETAGPNALVAIMSIPQHCGTPGGYYADANPTALRMDAAPERDQLVADIYRGLLAGSPEERALAAKGYMSMTGLFFNQGAGRQPVRFWGPDSVEYTRKMLLENPGVFSAFGELTDNKELVGQQLGRFKWSVSGRQFQRWLTFLVKEDIRAPIILHSDWGHPGINPVHGRVEPVKSAYENVDEIIRVFSKPEYRNVNIILAHTGIGRYVRPNDRPVEVTITNPKTGERVVRTVPEHVAKLYEIAEKVPNARFDISWNDVTQAYADSSPLKEHLLNFIIDHPTRVLFGSDTVNPPNAAYYNQGLNTGSPLFVDLAKRDPEALWNLIRGNFSVYDQGFKSVSEWTKQNHPDPDAVVKMEKMNAELDARRAVMHTAARKDFDAWVALVNSLDIAGLAKANNNPGFFPAHFASLPDIHNHAHTEPHERSGAMRRAGERGPGTPGGFRNADPAAHHLAKEARDRNVKAAAVITGTSAVAVGAAVASAQYDPAIAASVDGAHPVGSTVDAVAFGVRGLAIAARAMYTEKLRLDWELIFEEGHVTRDSLNALVSRIFDGAKAHQISDEQKLKVSAATEQFWANYQYLAEKPLSEYRGIHGTDEEAKTRRFDAIIDKTGEYQVTLDRILGLQGSSISPFDAREAGGKGYRAVTLLTYLVNDAVAIEWLTGGHLTLEHLSTPQGIAEASFHLLFALGNAVKTGEAIAGLSGGIGGRLNETHPLYQRINVLSNTTIATAAVFWTAGDLMKAVESLSAGDYGPGAVHSVNALLDAAFLYGMYRLSRLEHDRVNALPMPHGRNGAWAAILVGGALALREIIRVATQQEADEKDKASVVPQTAPSSTAPAAGPEVAPTAAEPAAPVSEHVVTPAPEPVVAPAPEPADARAPEPAVQPQ